MAVFTVKRSFDHDEPHGTSESKRQHVDSHHCQADLAQKTSTDRYDTKLMSASNIEPVSKSTEATCVKATATNLEVADTVTIHIDVASTNPFATDLAAVSASSQFKDAIVNTTDLKLARSVSTPVESTDVFVKLLSSNVAIINTQGAGKSTGLTGGESGMVVDHNTNLALTGPTTSSEAPDNTDPTSEADGFDDSLSPASFEYYAYRFGKMLATKASLPEIEQEYLDMEIEQAVYAITTYFTGPKAFDNKVIALKALRTIAEHFLGCTARAVRFAIEKTNDNDEREHEFTGLISGAMLTLAYAMDDDQRAGCIEWGLVDQLNVLQQNWGENMPNLAELLHVLDPRRFGEPETDNESGDGGDNGHDDGDDEEADEGDDDGFGGGSKEDLEDDGSEYDGENGSEDTDSGDFDDNI